jgi:hypothetical protein
MSPKEKAKQIVNTYDLFQAHIEYFSFNDAIQCALILVSEMKKQCWDYRDIDIQLSYDYWVQVEQEILILCESN